MCLTSRKKRSCWGLGSDYATARRYEEEPPAAKQDKIRAAMVHVDNYELDNLVESSYGTTWCTHPRPLHREDDVTTRLVSPVVTCTAAVTDATGSPCRAPDVMCLVNKCRQPNCEHSDYEAFLSKELMEL